MGWLDLLLPKDGGVEKRATDLVYGPKARHKLDIYAPRHAGENLPVMVFFYGGGWDSGSKNEYSFAGHAFAAMGYVTVIADYRVYPEVIYPDFLDDCGRVLEWVVRHASEFGGDPKRLIVGGHSAGAYNAVMAAVDPRFYGQRSYHSAIKAVVGISGPYDFYPFDVDVSIRSFGGAGAAEESQPILLDLSEAPPMFLAHGTTDKTVRLRNSEALAVALRNAGRRVEEVQYKGAGHALTLLGLFPWFRWRIAIYRDIRQLLASILR